MPSLKNHDYLYSFHNSSSPLHNSKGFIVAADYTKISSKDIFVEDIKNYLIFFVFLVLCVGVWSH